MAPDFPLTVFFDGSCAVCALEIERYRSLDRVGRLIMIDINEPDFEPGIYGLTREGCQRELHAIDHSGIVYRGVSAFTAIWQAFPESRLLAVLAFLAGLPLIHTLAVLGYRVFARLRRYLPKRAACPGDSCRVVRGFH